MLIPCFVLPCLLKHVIRCVWFIPTYYDFSLQECLHCFSEGRWPLLSAISSTSHSLVACPYGRVFLCSFIRCSLPIGWLHPADIFTAVYARHLSMISQTYLCDESLCLWHTNFDLCFQVRGNFSQLLFRIVFYMQAGVDDQQ